MFCLVVPSSSLLRESDPFQDEGAEDSVWSAEEDASKESTDARWGKRYFGLKNTSSLIICMLSSKLMSMNVCFPVLVRIVKKQPDW